MGESVEEGIRTSTEVFKLKKRHHESVKLT